MERPPPSPSPLTDVLDLEHPGIEGEAIERLLRLAVEIAREGREGRRIGTLFTLGDAEAVLKRSRPLILDPLLGHPAPRRSLADADLRETVKELAQLDGAFVVSGEGVFQSAGRYIDVSAESVQVPLGLGSRHLAAASISQATDCLAVVVSESAVVRVFHGGELAAEVIPELWMLRTHYSPLLDRTPGRACQDVTVVTKAEEERATKPREPGWGGGANAAGTAGRSTRAER